MEHGKDIERQRHVPASSPSGELTRDPTTLSFIERISWFEHERPMTADNDNATQAAEDNACFHSWAIPDYMRK